MALNELILPTSVFFAAIFAASCLIVAIFITFLTRIIQLRSIPHLVRMVFGNAKKIKKYRKIKTIGPFQALFASMSSTIGMGNIVGPSMAISLGGPGSILWMVFFMFLSSPIKFVEVTFAILTRERTRHGNIIAGPTQYLKLVSHGIAKWYGIMIIPLFIGWNAFQSNALASIFVLDGVPGILTGSILAAVVLFMLLGGAKRVGSVASKAVPVMFILYVAFATLIIYQSPIRLHETLSIMLHSAFNGTAATSGFLGATVIAAAREGVFRGVFVTEAGVGTSSIPHAFSDVENPTDQGVLAMLSMGADGLLCLISGLLVVSTGMWKTGTVTSSLVYQVFQSYANRPEKILLAVSVSLFAITTIVGNSFNGSRCFAAITRYRWMKLYYTILLFFVIGGAAVSVQTAFTISDILMSLVAIPNVICIAIIALKYKKLLRNPQSYPEYREGIHKRVGDQMNGS